MSRNPLDRNLPGIPSQRIRRENRKPVVQPKPGTDPMLGPTTPIPVNDTYADGMPDNDPKNQ